MTDRRSYLLAVLAVVAVGVAMRTVPLYWSPLPATLDGIGYAARARDALVIGRYPLAGMRADNFGFVGVLSVAGSVLDVRPLVLAQPLIAVVGGASCVTGMALVRRLARRIGLTGRGVRISSVAAGLALAVEGLYLRRTGVPDEEALAFLMLPLLVLALDRTFASRRAAWPGVALPFLVVFPLTHTFSTLIAALSVTALFALCLAERPSRRRLLIGLGLVGGFWVYFAAYYEYIERTVLSVPYVGRVTEHPGLFLAWTVVLVVGVVWFRRTSSRGQRALFLVSIGLWFLVLLANVVTPIFPGTVSSPPLLAEVLSLLVVPVVVAGVSVPALGRRDGSGAVLLALLAAPVTHVYFSLTAALTPEFFGTVMRTQTFAHLPVLGLAALTVGRWTDRSTLRTPSPRSALRAAGVVVLAVAVVATAPVAFVDLDTLAYPSTTTESEFAVASFAATTIPGAWTSDHVITRIGGHYFETGGGGIAPTASWLRGGPPPDCPVVSLASWTTTGAHFFPAAPATISPARYEAWVAWGNRIYAASGYDPATITIPPTESGAGC